MEQNAERALVTTGGNAAGNGVAGGAMAPSMPVANAAMQVLGSLGPGRIVALGLVAIALLAFFALIAMRTLEAPYTLLFGDLEPGDGQAIVGRLDALGIPYRVSADGSAVMVPANDAARLRMSLAEEGLAAGGVMGYELLDRAGPLGTTDFLANVNLRRALEGELGRSIASLRMVRSARVHLVEPKRELFQKDPSLPSASIVLAMRGGQRLDHRQVEGIEHLVAAAVPGLVPDRIAVVDDRGTLLARGGGEDAASGDIDDDRVAMEGRLRQRVVQLLERSVGEGRVSAEVSVDMKLDEVSTTTESFDPAGQVARSTQTSEETGDRREQDPTGGVSVANNLPTAGAQPPAASASSADKTSRTEETTNYEISRTVRSQVERPGAIRRLSIAVQVDGTYETAADGTRTYQARGEDELKQLTALVRSAVGIDDARGDVVEMVSRPFVVAATVPETAEPWLAGTEIVRLVEILVLALTGLAVVLLVVRPLLRRLLPPASGARPVTAGADGRPPLLAAGPSAASPGDGGQAGPTGHDGPSASRSDPPPVMVSLRQIQGQVRASLIDEVTKIVDESPEDAVRVVRSWLHGS